MSKLLGINHLVAVRALEKLRITRLLFNNSIMMVLREEHPIDAYNCYPYARGAPLLDEVG